MQGVRRGVGDILDHGQDDTKQGIEAQELGTGGMEDVAGLDSRQALTERSLVLFHHSK